MILDKRFPPDIRVEKEADALIRAGFEVGLLAPPAASELTVDPRLKLFPASAGPLGIGRMMKRRERYYAWSDRFRLAVKKLMGRPVANTFSWEYVLGCDSDFGFVRRGIAKQWHAVIGEFIQNFRPDVLHVHDFPLVPTALRAAEAHGIPLVADMHEDWSSFLQAYLADCAESEQQSFQQAWRLDNWTAWQNSLLPKCAAVIAVSQEMVDKFSSRGLSDENTVLVSNTSSSANILAAANRIDESPQYGPRWTAFYAGSMAQHRGVEVVIRAVPRIAAEVPNFLLVVAGADDKWKSKLSGLASELGVQQNVEVLGWIPQSEALGLMSQCDVGLVPHSRFIHTDIAIPHKLFQYMAVGTPVVVSTCPPLKRVIEDSEAGVVFEADDSESCANAILSIWRDEGLAERLGENGKHAANGKYSWQQDAQRLVNLYQRILKCDSVTQTDMPEMCGSQVAGKS